MIIDQIENDLPLVEKYRPKSLDDIVSHGDIMTTLKQFIDNKSLPHLLLHGPAGTGKTSCAQSIVNAVFDNDINIIKSNVIELNASDERGISVVRDQIKTFCNSSSLNKSSNTYKIIILDEADMMTSTAQAALRRVIETFSTNARFILICNQVNKLTPAIQSRCLRFRFAPLRVEQCVDKIKDICAKEQYIINKDEEDQVFRVLFDYAKGDMRKILNTIESTALAFDNHITEEGVCKVTARPSFSLIKKFILKNEQIGMKEAIDELIEMKQDMGFSIPDIVDQVLKVMMHTNFNNKENKNIIKIFRLLEKADYSSYIGTNVNLILANIVSCIRHDYL